LGKPPCFEAECFEAEGSENQNKIIITKPNMKVKWVRRAETREDVVMGVESEFTLYEPLW
jgi:hypothetical protein